MGKQEAREQANLAEFVAVHGGRGYAAVPVSGQALGWPPESPVHHVDAVWFETSEPRLAMPNLGRGDQDVLDQMRMNIVVGYRP